MQNKHIRIAPVLFLIFNRLDTTKRVFQVIRDAKPQQLFIAADGARKEKKGEFEKCKAVREYVLSNIDWDCEVKTLFQNNNLGCGIAISTAISWFFHNIQEGIILEDDCLPHFDFFRYCSDLLDLYRNDTRIFLISGYNKQGLWNPDWYDYFFSNLGGIWGWASWARAWKYFDFKMLDIDDFIRKNNFKHLLGAEIGAIRQDTIYSEIITNKIDAWSYQWGYARHKNNGLSCVPSKNLIINIGFMEDATHTKEKIIQPDCYGLHFPLKINHFFVPDREYDKKFVGYEDLKKQISGSTFVVQYLPSFLHRLAMTIDANGLSYLGLEALKELMQAVVTCEMQGLQGIIIEAGCALGGSAIGITAAKSMERELRCYDVFGLIPPPSQQDGVDVHARYAEIVSGKSAGLKGDVYYGYRENLLSVVENNFSQYGFPIGENSVCLVKGLYEETLQITTPVILAHIDCDWYDSVKLCLERICPYIVNGGVMIIDDYHHYSGCKQAVDEFMSQNDAFERIDGKSRLHLRKR